MADDMSSEVRYEIGADASADDHDGRIVLEMARVLLRYGEPITAVKLTESLAWQPVRIVRCIELLLRSGAFREV